MDFKEMFGEELGSQIENVVKEKGIKLAIDAGDKIPKNRFDEVIGVKNELKAQVSELTNQLEGLKKANEGNKDLTSQIEALQKSNEELMQKHQRTIIESAIKFEAVKAKAKDANDLTKFLDVSKLEIDEKGNISGLDVQINELKEQKAYLFDSDKPASSSGTNPANNKTAGGRTEVEELQDSYKKAIKEGNTALAIAIKNKLFNMKG